MASLAALSPLHSRSWSEELLLAGSHPAHPVFSFLSPSLIARVGIATGPENGRIQHRQDEQDGEDDSGGGTVARASDLNTGHYRRSMRPRKSGMPWTWSM
jgi:hypothetical protein